MRIGIGIGVGFGTALQEDDMRYYFTYPTAGATLQAYETHRLRLYAKPSPESVTIYYSGDSIGSATIVGEEAYLDWTPHNDVAGTDDLSAVVTWQATAPSVEIVVAPGTEPPTVAITSPESSDTAYSGTTLTVTVTATPGSNDVASVIGTIGDYAFPFDLAEGEGDVWSASHTVTEADAELDGSTVLTVLATDTMGLTATATVTFTVRNAVARLAAAASWLSLRAGGGFTVDTGNPKFGFRASARADVSGNSRPTSQSTDGYQPRVGRELDGRWFLHYLSSASERMSIHADVASAITGGTKATMFLGFRSYFSGAVAGYSESFDGTDFSWYSASATGPRGYVGAAYGISFADQLEQYSDHTTILKYDGDGVDNAHRLMLRFDGDEITWNGWSGTIPANLPTLSGGMEAANTTGVSPCSQLLFAAGELSSVMTDEVATEVEASYAAMSYTGGLLIASPLSGATLMAGNPAMFGGSAPAGATLKVCWDAAYTQDVGTITRDGGEWYVIVILDEDHIDGEFTVYVKATLDGVDLERTVTFTITDPTENLVSSASNAIALWGDSQDGAGTIGSNYLLLEALQPGIAAVFGVGDVGTITAAITAAPALKGDWTAAPLFGSAPGNHENTATGATTWWPLSGQRHPGADPMRSRYSPEYWAVTVAGIRVIGVDTRSTPDALQLEHVRANLQIAEDAGMRAIVLSHYGSLGKDGISQQVYWLPIQEVCEDFVGTCKAVFTGHQHRYWRTAPMVLSAAATPGIVYCCVGQTNAPDLLSNEFPWATTFDAPYAAYSYDSAAAPPAGGWVQKQQITAEYGSVMCHLAVNETTMTLTAYTSSGGVLTQYDQATIS